MSGTDRTIAIVGLDVPTHIMVDILNCAANAMYDRQKAVKTELAAIDMDSDTRSVSFQNVCANYDHAELVLEWLDKIDKARKAAKS